MNTKIIDFSNGESADQPLLVQPNFKIRGDNVSIEFKSPKWVPTFYIHVGCQGVNMNSDTIQNAIQELNEIPYEPVATEVLVEKGKNPKTSSPRLMESVGNWFITKDGKAFSHDTHEIKVIDIKQKRKYFSPNKRAWNKKEYPLTFRGGYDLSTTDIEKIKSILDKIEKYFNSIPAEPAL